jgi:hypothetical protein
MYMQKFNLEYQYQLYLQRMALSEDKMHPEQQKQLRQTFMGACGQILVMLRDDIPELEENKACNVLDDMMNQVSVFFTKEILPKK